MVEKSPPMTPEEKQRLLDMADRVLNSELGPFLTQVIDALYEDEMAKRAAAERVSTSGTEARHAPEAPALT